MLVTSLFIFIFYYFSLSFNIFVLDASGTPRIPIVPVGLIYSHPSGYRFRQSVLVDFGHPIHISDEQMKIASTGEEGERKIAKKITTQLLQHLKEVC